MSVNSEFLMPPGAILAYGGAKAPSGWLLCDGSSVPRQKYKDLFQSIGTAYGAGDGRSTFNLPDLRGRFCRGTDNGAGNDPDAASRTASNTGGSTGDSVGSLQADQFRAHTHSGTYWQQTGGGPSAGISGYGTSGGVSGSGAVPSDGGNETRPKNVNVNYIIKI